MMKRLSTGRTGGAGCRCPVLVLLAGLCVFGAVGCASSARTTGGEAMPDLSGLAWLHDDVFVAVHDAKRSFEAGRPRVSLLRLPGPSESLRWTPLDVTWPDPFGLSNDLESIARIPGTSTFLLVESGSDTSAYRRIFMAGVEGERLRIDGAVDWPVPVRNVEGSAVARCGDGLVFVFAERAQGRDHTQITWMPFHLDPPAFGAPDSAAFRSPDPTGPDARPVSALEVDGRGRLFAASASDPGDTGPFRSTVWEIGTVCADTTGPAVTLTSPKPWAVLDGLKVESLAARERQPGVLELFAGTDDEGYGAVVRPLPVRE